MTVPANQPHSPSSDLARLQTLLAAHAAPRGTISGPGRPELTAAMIGSTVTLPAATPLWRHLDPGSRELHLISYTGDPLVVHNVEPAGASFLVHNEAGPPKTRRGPAVTLRLAAEDANRELLVLFAGDITA